MSRYIFLFNLNATITRREFFSEVSRKLGVHDRMRALEESAMQERMPYKQGLMQKVKLLKEFPVSEVRRVVGEIPVNERLAAFIKANRESCYIVTSNLDVWLEEFVAKLGMEGNFFSSRAVVKDDYIQEVHYIADKGAASSQMVLPLVAVGNGNNDAEMIDAAEVGIGYGGVRRVVPAVLSCASHAIYDEDKLVEFLERLV